MATTPPTPTIPPPPPPILPNLPLRVTRYPLLAIPHPQRKKLPTGAIINLCLFGAAGSEIQGRGHDLSRLCIVISIPPSTGRDHDRHLVVPCTNDRNYVNLYRVPVTLPNGANCIAAVDQMIAVDTSLRNRHEVRNPQKPFMTLDNAQMNKLVVAAQRLCS